MEEYKYTINGCKVTLKEYYDSNEDGTHRVYHSNGQLEYETLWVNGEVHGTHKSYYPNGQLQSELPYVHGEQHGIVRAYNEDGTVKEETVYVNGIERPDLKDNRLAKIVLFGVVHKRYE